MRSPRGSGPSPARLRGELWGGTATDRVTTGCPPLSHLGNDLRRRPPRPNRALDRQPAASQLAPGLGSPTPRSPIRAPHPAPAPAPRPARTLHPYQAPVPRRATYMPWRCPRWVSPAPSGPQPGPCPFYGPTSAHAPAPRPWLPAAGRAPGAQAGGEEDVCPAERPRGAAAAGSGGAITAVSLFPWAGATDERGHPASDHKLLRQPAETKVPRAAAPRAVAAAAPARSPQLCSAARPGSVRSAGARPQGKALGSGRGEGGRGAGRGTVPAGPPAARAAPSCAAAAPRLISGPARTRPAAARLAAQPPVAIAMSPPHTHRLLTAIG